MPCEDWRCALDIARAVTEERTEYDRVDGIGVARMLREEGNRLAKSSDPIAGLARTQDVGRTAWL